MGIACIDNRLAQIWRKTTRSSINEDTGCGDHDPRSTEDDNLYPPAPHRCLTPLLSCTPSIAPQLLMSRGGSAMPCQGLYTQEGFRVLVGKDKGTCRV